MDTHVSILTPQNVPISYPIAGVHLRIGAYLLDVIFIIAYIYFIFSFLIQVLVSDGTPPTAVLLILLSPALFYSLILETLMNGQTLGKFIVGTRVVCLDGGRPGWENYLIRWLIGTIENPLTFGFIAFMVYTFSKKGQRLGDFAADTTVISVRFNESFNDTIFRDLTDNYSVTYPEVVRFTDRDISIINETLMLNKNNPNSVNIEQLAKKIEEILGIQRKKNAVDFLKTIINDFNYLTQQNPPETYLLTSNPKTFADNA